jgi:hypothetical protein
MKKLSSILLAAAVIASLSIAPAARAAGSLEAICRADLPVHPGETMTWRATVTGGSGTYTYSWSGTDGLTGSGSVATHAYPAVGYVVAQVDVTDAASSEHASAGCAMHVIPTSFSEPPSVTPVLWVPKGVDPSPLVPRLKRAWRSIHALFVHFYGKTFRMKPMLTIVSPKTEADICGGDCTDLKMGDTLMGQAFAEANAQVHTIAYTRAMLVMAWGAGGWAGANGWDIGIGGIGDLAVAPAAGRRTPAIEPDLPDWLLPLLGDYEHGLYDSIAHELNHVIAWDDPHDFSINNPPNAYERAVALAGPFLTQSLSDPAEPTVGITRPTTARVSGIVNVSVDASDATGVDAVILLVDGQFWAQDRSAPYSISVNTRLLGDGKRRLAAVALDTSGNRAKDTRAIIVRNKVPGDSCAGGYPTGTFHACIFEGIGSDGPYLGSFVDHPFPVAAPNAGYGLSHDWGVGPIAFTRADMVTGVWRGRLDFPKANYILRFFTDDGLRVFVNGDLVIDEWRDPQVAEFSRVVALDGATNVRVEWYEQAGAAGLRFWWQPTNSPPS